MHFSSIFPFVFLATALTVSASEGTQLVKRKAAAPIAKNTEPFYSHGSQTLAEQAPSDTSRKSTTHSRMSYDLECKLPDCGKSCACDAKGKIRCKGCRKLGPQLQTQVCRRSYQCRIANPQERATATRTAYKGSILARNIPSVAGSSKGLFGHSQKQDSPSIPERLAAKADCLNLLHEREASSSRKASPPSHPPSQAATQPVALRKGLIPWCGSKNMMGLTGPLCINYCACNSNHEVYCSPGKGMIPTAQEI